MTTAWHQTTWWDFWRRTLTMGTNYYWARSALGLVLPEYTPRDPWAWELEERLEHGIAERPYIEDEDVAHIGKRSGAGAYCWDCDLTLCLDGKVGIHTGRSAWADTCLRCSAPPHPPIEAAPIQHGRPTGVAYACSFTWAQDPEHVGTLCRLLPDQVLVADEMDRTFTGVQFLELLEESCPIQYTDSIGLVFS